MRALILALLVCGCASRSKEAPAPAATTVAASLPSNAAPKPPATPETGKQAAPVAPPPSTGAAAIAPAGPMTAAEAAAATAQHGASADGAGSDDSPCASDSDCAFTMVGPGGCCPMLCTPRAVTRKAADAIEARMQECTGGKPCPLPACAPPRFQTAPACEMGRCISRTIRAPQ